MGGEMASGGEGAGKEPNAIHREECVEEIPNREVYWEETRRYCGRCDSELETEVFATDVFDQIITRKARPIPKFEDEDYDDEAELDDDND